MTYEKNERRKSSIDLSTTVYGKVPPKFSGEGDLVGICMLEPAAAIKICSLVKSHMFYEERNQKVFAAIEILVSRNEGIDLLTVSRQLSTGGMLEAVGGFYYLSELTKHVVSSAHAKEWCQILVKTYLSREVIHLSGKLISDAYDQSVEIDTLIAAAGNAYNFLLSSIIQSESIKVPDLFFQRYQLLLAGPTKEGLSGVPTGYYDLDKLTAGWQEGDLVILAARPSMGKTALAAQLCYRTARAYNVPTLFISLEMTNIKIVDRIISSECNIHQSQLQRNIVNQGEIQAIGNYINKHEHVPMQMNDESRQLSDIEGTIRRQVEKYGTKLVVIDYLQLIETSENRTFGQNRDQQIGQITAKLKGLAKQLRITIIALSQLSRKTEERTNKRPMLGDLRESGNIEQDADLVFMLHRAWYYIEREGNLGMADMAMQVDAELICAKNRNGALDTVHFRFLSKYVGFYDMNDDYLDFSEVPSGPPDPYSPYKPLPFPDNDGF